jgi:hypothetical protein
MMSRHEDIIEACEALSPGTPVQDVVTVQMDQPHDEHSLDPCDVCETRTHGARYRVTLDRTGDTLSVCADCADYLHTGEIDPLYGPQPEGGEE